VRFAANGVAAITEQGFAALTDQELWRRVAGNTLRLAGSLGYFRDDRSVELASTALGSGLTSSGTWKIKKMNVCHSIRDGHEFCTGLYFRGEEILCWPGIGHYALDTGYLRACVILRGNRVASAPIGTVLAAMETVPAKDAPRAMEKHGFVQLSGNEIWRRIVGKTLRMPGSYGRFAKDKTVTIESTSLGSGLTSSGTWKIKKRNVCHSIREGHEFCTGLYFRGEEVLCWPGIGRYAPDTGYLRECRVLPGKGAI
jgi:hypothetical protein